MAFAIIRHMCEQCKPGAFSPPSPPRLGTRLGIYGLFLLHIPSNSMHNRFSDTLFQGIIIWWNDSCFDCFSQHRTPFIKTCKARPVWNKQLSKPLSCLLQQGIFHLHSQLFSPLLGHFPITLTPSLGCSPQFEPSQTCSVEVGDIQIVTVTLRHLGL